LELIKAVPLYEYECRKCGARSEVMQKMTDKPLTKCKECGGRLEKLLSAPAIQFKGSGWYVTDYAGKKGEAAEASQKSDGKEEKKGAAETASASDKATPKETAPSKKASKSKPSPSSGD
jgi:putative FmdB family regulatory protein